jgi:DNA-binding MarR family transcriptional regulator
MYDSSGRFEPEGLRHLFHLKTLAGERHRAALARTLKLSDTEAAALAHLASRGQLTPGELGALLNLTSGGTTALIHRLERGGHLARHPHPDDRRSILLTATEAIVASAEELYAPLIAEMDEVSERLNDEERAIVGRYLTAIAAVSQRHAERLDAAARADDADVVAVPAPGLWA